VSYILDALRKSEDQRRLGQSPDLHSAPVTPSSSSAHSSRLRIAAIVVVLITVVATLGYWLLFSQTDKSASSVAEAPEVTASSPADQSGSVDRTAAEQALGPESEAGVPGEEKEPAPRRRRTVIDRRSPNQEPVTTVSRPAPARPGTVPKPPPVVPQGERERLVTDPEQARRLIEEQTQSPPTGGSATEQPATVRSSDSPQPSDDGAEDGNWEPERIEFVEVWDLPLSVRQELPELDLSIHVFSGEPAERFVLINGERRLEGTALGGGVRLAEIVRQGAIVEFRDYRFLLRP